MTDVQFQKKTQPCDISATSAYMWLADLDCCKSDSLSYDNYRYALGRQCAFAELDVQVLQGWLPDAGGADSHRHIISADGAGPALAGLVHTGVYPPFRLRLCLVL